MLTERERKLIRQVFREVPRRRRGPKGYADWEIVEVVLEGLRLGASGIRAVERMQKWRGKGPMPSAATLSRRLKRLANRIWALCRILSRTRAEVGAVDATGIRTRVKGSNWGWSSNYKLYQGLKVHAVVAVDGCVRDLEVTAAAGGQSTAPASVAGPSDTGKDSTAFPETFTLDDLEREAVKAPFEGDFAGMRFKNGVSVQDLGCPAEAKVEEVPVDTVSSLLIVRLDFLGPEYKHKGALWAIREYGLLSYLLNHRWVREQQQKHLSKLENSLAFAQEQMAEDERKLSEWQAEKENLDRWYARLAQWAEQELGYTATNKHAVYDLDEDDAEWDEDEEE